MTMERQVNVEVEYGEEKAEEAKDLEAEDGDLKE